MTEVLRPVTCFAHAQAAYSLRTGGVSLPPYDCLNLGDHVGDDLKAVARNRAIFAKAFGADPVYMQQVHGTEVIVLDARPAAIPVCDALVTATPGLALAVMTADCLPLLLCSEDGRACAAVHCGWKGLAGGIVANTVKAMRKLTSAPIAAYMGPCIGPASFEVGPEVKERFATLLGNVDYAFAQGRSDRLWCSLPSLCAAALKAEEIDMSCVHQAYCDTFADPAHFFSYRRNPVTGRMATVVMLTH